MEPAAFTPRWLAGLDGRIWVHCPGCREVREIPLRKLIEAGREKQPIAAMVFRCHVRSCGQTARAVTEWRDARGDWQHDYASGETRPREPLPGVYAPPDQR